MKKAKRRNGPADEMLPEYDFSRMSVAARGKHAMPVPPGKTRITIRIDTDILDWFYEQVDRAGGGSYQASINQALREHMNREALEPMLRRVVREELRRQRKAS